MPYFAQLENNEVTRVIVADNIQWCQSRLGGTWLTTSYNATVRKNYAGIGYAYRADIDAFVPPQPVFNYELNDKARWEFKDDVDTVYVLIAKDAAYPLSKALFSLIYPGKEGMYCGIIPHATREDLAVLQLRSTDMVPIALGADASPLIAILMPFVDMQVLTKAEVDAIAKGVSDNAGKLALITDFIPASWLEYVADKTRALASGWIT